LVLPFVLEGLFQREVAAYNARHAASEAIQDPSDELVSVSNSLLAWYKLYRRSNPPKDALEIARMNGMAER